jgi:uncharacterized repeat protein (TIGR01451 family)
MLWGNDHRRRWMSSATTVSLAVLFWLAFSTTVHANSSAARLAANCPSGAIIYVNQNANGSNTGASWTHALRKLQDALTLADSCPTANAIWVAKGIYYPDEGTGFTNDDRNATFKLRPNVAIYGGFAGGESQLTARNWQSNVTVLSGDLNQNDTTENGISSSPTQSNNEENAYTVISSRTVTQSATLDGFTITSGRADIYGGGIYNVNSSPTLRNLIIIGNYSSTNGGGIYNQNSDPLMENMIFRANYSRLNGAALYNSNSDPTIINALFSGNHAFNQAGAIFNNGSRPTIINATISGNRAKGTAALYNNSSSPTLINAIIWNNNSTFSNYIGDDIGKDATSQPKFQNSLLEGASISSNWQNFGKDEGNNQDRNPNFVTPVDSSAAPTSTGNLQLASGSPAADAGFTEVNTTTLDIAGAARIQGFVIDLGAYESPYTAHLTATAASTPAQIEYGEILTHTVVVTNSGDAYAYQVLFTDTLPSNVAFAAWVPQPAGAAYNNGSHTITWQGILTASKAISFTFVTTHTGDADEPITNTITVDHPTGDVNATATTTVLPLPTVDLADTTVSEAGGQATFTVTLSAPTRKSVSLRYTTSNGSALAPGDFTAASNTLLTIPPSTQQATFTVPVINDDIDEDQENFQVVLSAPINAILGDVQGTATILDDDTVGNAVTPQALTLREPSGNGNFTITLTSQPESVVTVGLTSTDESECNVQASVTLNATNWRTGVAVPINVVDDDVVDGDQICFVQTVVSSSDAKYNGMAMEDITVTVESEDVAGVVLEPDTPIVSEPSSNTLIKVTLTSQPVAPVQIALTSTVSTECRMETGSVTIEPSEWRTGKLVSVIAVDEDVDDGDQICIVQTTASSSDPIYEAIAVVDPPVTVIDDDVSGVAITPTSITVSEPNTTNNFSLKLTSKPSQPVRINLSSSDTGECRVSTNSVTLDSTNWNVSVIVPVTAVDDAIDDDDQSCSIRTSVTSNDPKYNGVAADDVAVTVQDDNDTAGMIVSTTALTVSEPSGTANYQFSLNSQPVSSVVVNLTTTDPSECSVPASITLNSSNWRTGLSVKVTAVDDFIIDKAQNCVIRATGSSNDNKYTGMEAADVTATVLDNDTAGVIFTPDQTSMSEKDGNIFLVTKLTSQPFAPVTINLNNDDTTECDVPSSVTIDNTNWQTGVGVTILSIDDDLDDETQRCTIQSTVNSSDTDYQGLTVAPLALEITDDETAGFVVTPSRLTVSEPAGANDFVVALTSEPTATVTITLTSSDLTECQGPATLKLGKNNWRTGATATVTAIDDRIADDARPCAMQMVAASSDGDYNGLPLSNLAVTVEDDDRAGLTVTPTQLTVQEPDITDTFTITLTSEPTATVTIALTTDDAGECAMPAQVTLDETNWEQGVAVPVNALDDLIDDGDQTCIVQLSVSSADAHYAGIAAGDVTTTVQDDGDTAGVIVNTKVLTVSEPAGTQSYTVVLTSEPAMPVTLTMAPANGQCSATQSLLFTAANWQIAQTVTVAAVDDLIVDGARLCTLNTVATSGDSGYHGIAVAPVAVTVQDDGDTAGILATPTTLNLSEPTGQSAITFALTSQPTATVEIALTSTDPSECQPAGNVTLDATNWQSGVTISVAVVDDQLDDGAQPCPVQMAVTSADPSYHQWAIEPLTFTVADSDVVALQVAAAADVTTAQLGQTIQYSYLVTNTGDVTLTLTALDSRAGAVNFTPQTLAPSAVAQGSGQYLIRESDAPGPLQSNLVVTSTAALGTIITDAANTTVAIAVMPSVDVSVKRLGPPQISAGMVVTYQVTMSNTGFTAAVVNRIEGTPNTALQAADNTVTTCVTPLTLAPKNSQSCFLFWNAVKTDSDVVEFTVNVHLQGPLQSTAVLNGSATVVIGGPNDLLRYLFLPLVKR